MAPYNVLTRPLIDCLMRLKQLIIALLLILPVSLAAAQAPEGARLASVTVEGTTTFADIVRVVLASRTGTPVAEIDLEAERNRVYALGSFAAVSVNLETRAGQTSLAVTVRENPRIDSITFEGVSAVPEPQLAAIVEQENILSAGRVLNTTRAQEGVATIQAVYRQQGFPFAVPVTLDLYTVIGSDGTEQMVINYIVEENPRVDEVSVSGVETLDHDTIAGFFRPLTITGEFDIDLYRTAVNSVEEAYREEGYRLSGVDLSRSNLAAGVLEVPVVERRITAVDTGAIGVDPAELSLGIGDLFNYDVLLQDVRRLAAGRRGDVRLETQAIGSGGVRVVLVEGPPETAGVITEIEISGNTRVPTEELLPLLHLQVGETFTSTLAQEDYDRIAARYLEDGWLILGTPDFNWLDGKYVQRISEVRVGGVQVTWEGERGRTQDWVVTRYLPQPGEVINQNELRSALMQIQQLGVVEPMNIVLLAAEEPDEAIINVVVGETGTGVFTPSAQYSTDTGFSLSLSYSQLNLWGRAHNVSVEVTGQTSQLGLLLGGSIRYSIPWLYVDFLDFKRVPTSLSLTLFSIPTPNQPMSAGNALTAPYPGTDQHVPVGEFMSRESGLNFSAGRPIFTNTSLGLSARIANTSYVQEPPAVACSFDEDGNITNAQRCALPYDEATQYLPQGGVNSFFSVGVVYDSRDNPDFPRRGLYANTLVGFGFGNDFAHPDTGDQTSYNYQQFEIGLRSYLQLNRVIPQLNEGHVLAFRVNFGHQFGDLYPVARRFTVGKTNNIASAIRGFQSADFGLSRTYATSSLEYRYDFGLQTVATQTVIGIVFADLGWASSATGFPEYETPLFASAGVGVQVNLGFGGVLLPALRFDYAFSERHPTGEFRFRVGGVY